MLSLHGNLLRNMLLVQPIAAGIQQSFITEVRQRQLHVYGNLSPSRMYVWNTFKSMGFKAMCKRASYR